MLQEMEILTEDTLKKLIFMCEAADVKRLKQITLDNDTTLNVLLLEGVSYILKKYKRE